MLYAVASLLMSQNTIEQEICGVVLVLSLLLRHSEWIRLRDAVDLYHVVLRGDVGIRHSV